MIGAARRVEVVRDAEDLRRKVWTFWLDEHLRMHLDAYDVQTRPTKRHKWRNDEAVSWRRLRHDRYHARGPRPERVPAEVAAEAIGAFRSSVVEAEVQGG